MAPRDPAGGDGTAYVEGLRATGQPESLGLGSDRGVEVESIGEVELGLHAGGPPQGDLLVEEGDVAVLGSLVGVLLGQVRHEPGDRDLHEPVELGHTDLVRHSGQLGIHEPRCLHAQPEGGGRDPAGTPGLKGSFMDPGPVKRQAVLQLQRVGDLRPTGVGGTPDRSRELGDAELRDQRRTLTGQRQRTVTATGRPGGRIMDRLRRMLLTPRGRGEQHVGLGSNRSGALARANANTSVVLSSSSRIVVMDQSKQRPLTVSAREFAVHTGNSMNLPRRAGDAAPSGSALHRSFASGWLGS